MTRQELKRAKKQLEKKNAEISILEEQIATLDKALPPAEACARWAARAAFSGSPARLTPPLAAAQ